MRNFIKAVLFLFVVVISGCSKQEGRDDLTRIIWRVTTNTGVPIPNVTVSIGDNYAESDHHGDFSCPVSLHSKQGVVSFKHYNYTDCFIPVEYIYKTNTIHLLEKSEHEKSNTVEVAIKQSFTDTTCKVKSEFSPSTLLFSELSPSTLLFRGIYPGGEIFKHSISSKTDTSRKDLYYGFVKLTVEDKQGRQLKHFRKDQSAKIKFKIPTEIKYDTACIAHFWRFDEEYNCWIMGPRAIKENGNYTATVNEPGWWCVYGTPEPIECVKTRVTDHNGNAVPYAMLSVTDEDFRNEWGKCVSTKNGKVIFYTTNAAKTRLIFKGFYALSPSNDYPFVDYEKFLAFDKRIHTNTRELNEHNISIQEIQEGINTYANNDDEQALNNNLISKENIKYGEIPYLLKDTNAVVVEEQNRMVTLTSDMLGLGKIKDIYKGKQDFLDNAKVTIRNDGEVLITSKDYKDLLVIIFPKGGAACFCVDWKEQIDTNWEKRRLINAFVYKLPKNENGFALMPIIYDDKNGKEYPLGKLSFGVKTPVDFYIDHENFGKRKLTRLGTEIIDISKDIALVAKVNDDCRLNIRSVTDAYGRNAMSDIRKDIIKPQALLTGKLYVDFYGRDSVYNQSITFQKYDKHTLKYELKYEEERLQVIYPIGISIGILFLCCIYSIKKNRYKKKVMESEIFKLIASVLRLNPAFTSKQNSLIENFLKDKHLSIDGLTTIRKMVEGKMAEESINYSELKKLDFTQSRDLIHLLFKLSAEDDGIKNDEWNLLLLIMGRLGMNTHNIEYMKRRYSPLRTEYDDYSKYYSSRSKSSSSSSSSTSGYANASDYAQLGLVPGATNEDVQKAYHKLAMDLHPDLPKNKNHYEECIRRMASINVAYRRLIKK